MNSSLILATVLVALWTLGVLVLGLMMGWRARSGIDPVPIPSNPFARSAEPKEPKKPKAQENP